jgi:signal transduction histidine kinase
VNATNDGGTWEFAVTDNGIGIAPEFREKVFILFQRLHTKDAYPGTGIGLAMCKKVVEFHDGTIRLDPDVELGTRVVFTLPAVTAATAAPDRETQP